MLFSYQPVCIWLSLGLKIPLMKRNTAFIDCVLSKQTFKVKNPKAAEIPSFTKKSLNKIISYLNI